MTDAPKIFPVAPGVLTVDFGNEISVPLNDKAISLAERLDQNSFTGFIEAAPAYSSVAVFYDVGIVRKSFSQYKTSYDAVRNIVTWALDDLSKAASTPARTIEIPVDFSKTAALDLDFVASERGMSRTEVIELFVSGTYRVFMLGFLPGFAYLGELDERIAMPRKQSPRTHVPKGSVGIAGRQTGVYPLESPGGWQIIGRTKLEMFIPHAKTPSLLQPGDKVQFVAV